MPTSKNSHAGRGREPANAITPELALVSPELAEVDRRRLPDRPWEAVAPVSAQSELRATASDDGARRRRFVRVLVLATVAVTGLLLVVPHVRDTGSEHHPPATGTPIRTTPKSPRLEPRPLLLPRAGYVVLPGGSFMTGASGRMIESFTLPVRCDSRQVVVADIPVVGRSLRFEGRSVGRAVIVRLSGRVVDRERVRGVVAATGPGCASRPIRFLARLS
jgi:hypothetical protein